MILQRWLLVGIVTGMGTGCTRPPEAVPVEGSVASKGKPLAKVMVKYYADGETHAPLISAITDGSGRYRLKNDGGASGTVAGTYRVCLVDCSETPLQRANDSFAGKGPPGGVKLPLDKTKQGAALNPHAGAKKAGASHAIPDQYSRPETTPLRAQVVPGQGSLDFQIP